MNYRLLVISAIFFPLTVFAGKEASNSFFMHILISWFPTIVLIILFLFIVKKITKRNKDYQDKQIEINSKIADQIKRIADAIDNKYK